MLDHKADLMVRFDLPLTRKVWRQQLILDLQQPLLMGESLPGSPRVGSTSLVLPEAEQMQRVEAMSEIDNGLTHPEIRGNAAAMVETMRSSLVEAECFHVTPEMTQMVLFAASQLDELDRIDVSVVPTRSGLVRFEGGLPFRDVRGRMMRLSWMSWSAAMFTTKTVGRHDVGEPEEALLVGMFNDHYEEPDEIHEITMSDPHYDDANHRSVFGRWGFMGVEPVYSGQRLGPAMAMPGQRKTAEIMADGDAPSEFTNAIRLVHAFWLLVGQTVSTATEAPLDRATRKRAGRAGLPPRVTVISLRNTETKRAEGESLVEWNHRWMVRGFWRWQVCGPNHPLAQEIEPGKWRARIWVAPFVKGPADKPLVVSEKVYAVHR